MNKLSALIAAVSILPNLAMAGTDLDAAANDLCACGMPPSSACFDQLSIKYPEVNRSRELQDRVMTMARERCATGGGASTPVPGMGMLPPGIAKMLKGVGGTSGAGATVSSTQDCSTQSFTVAIPSGWQCRKQSNNAQDVTLHTKGNTLGVTLGLNQGMTSCSVIPICTSEAFQLNSNFDTKLYKNPMAGTHEYAGTYKNDSRFKLTITSNTQPTADDLAHIDEILGSFSTR